LSAASGVVVAQEPLPPQQEDSQHIPDLGPDEPGLTSGEGGYKVFGPRAVLFVPIQPLASSDKRSPLALYRAGYSDVYQSGDNMKGSHNSQSDLVEDKIWVDGAIKRSLHEWDDSCSRHIQGQFAHCSTSMFDPQGPNFYTAHSWHYFEKAGYADEQFETEDKEDS